MIAFFFAFIYFFFLIFRIDAETTRKGQTSRDPFELNFRQEQRGARRHGKDWREAQAAQF